MVAAVLEEILSSKAPGTELIDAAMFVGSEISVFPALESRYERQAAVTKGASGVPRTNRAIDELERVPEGLWICQAAEALMSGNMGLGTSKNVRPWAIPAKAPSVLLMSELSK